MKEWLTRALVKALKDEKHVISHKYFVSTHLSISQCSTILSEIVEGESKLTETDASRTFLRTNLGLIEQSLAVVNNVADDIIIERKKKNSFQRKAKRDPVGKS